MARIRWKDGALPNPFNARVQWAFDGDTLLPAGYAGSRVVRLFGADAPEWGQAWFLLARAELLKIVRGKMCQFEPMTLDRYGRVVCKIKAPPNTDVSEAMIRAGLAWWDLRYARHEKGYEAAELEARAAHRCIWSERYHGYAPWVWRRIKRIT